MVVVVSDSDGKATYSVTYDNELFVAASALGMKNKYWRFYYRTVYGRRL